MGFRFAVAGAVVLSISMYEIGIPGYWCLASLAWFIVLLFGVAFCSVNGRDVPDPEEKVHVERVGRHYRALPVLAVIAAFSVILADSVAFGQGVRQSRFGPPALQSTLRDPQLNEKAAGITEPERDVPLSGIGGISWGTDVRFIRGLKHVSDADMLGGIAQYVMEKPLTHVEQVPVDGVLFGFWNGMFCTALIDLKDLQRYLAFKQRFTTIFGPPYIEKNGAAEKCSWRAKYAIILMRYDGPKGRITVWSDEIYKRMVAATELRHYEEELRAVEKDPAFAIR